MRNQILNLVRYLKQHTPTYGRVYIDKQFYFVGAYSILLSFSPYEAYYIQYIDGGSIEAWRQNDSHIVDENRVLELLTKFYNQKSQQVNTELMSNAAESTLCVQKIRNQDLYYINMHGTSYYYDVDTNTVSREDNAEMRDEESLDVIIYVGNMLELQQACA